MNNDVYSDAPFETRGGRPLRIMKKKLLWQPACKLPYIFRLKGQGMFVRLLNVISYLGGGGLGGFPPFSLQNHNVPIIPLAQHQFEKINT